MSFGIISVLRIIQIILFLVIPFFVIRYNKIGVILYLVIITSIAVLFGEAYYSIYPRHGNGIILGVITSVLASIYILIFYFVYKAIKAKICHFNIPKVIAVVSYSILLLFIMFSAMVATSIIILSRNDQKVFVDTELVRTQALYTKNVFNYRNLYSMPPEHYFLPVNKVYVKDVNSNDIIERDSIFYNTYDATKGASDNMLTLMFSVVRINDKPFNIIVNIKTENGYKARFLYHIKSYNFEDYAVVYTPMTDNNILKAIDDNQKIIITSYSQNDNGNMQEYLLTHPKILSVIGNVMAIFHDWKKNLHNKYN